MFKNCYFDDFVFTTFCLSRYLEWNEPLLDSDEKAATKQVVTEFLRNEGPVLQEKLKERASTRRNWVATYITSCLF